MAWDADKPAGTQKLRLADDDIRTNNAALEDAIDRDHNFPGTLGDDAGEHTRVKFYAPVATPTNASNKGFLYTKDVSSKAELHWLDEDGNEVQVSSAGVIVGVLEAGTKMLFYQNTAPTGWTIDTGVDDKLVFVTKGSGAGGQTGGAAHSTGTWTQPTHAHTSGSLAATHIHQIYNSAGDSYDDQYYNAAGSLTDFGYVTKSVNFGYPCNLMLVDTVVNPSTAKGPPDMYTDSKGTVTGSTASGSGSSGWRPAAYSCIIAEKD